VTSRSVTRARWFQHANGVNPPREMRHWLTDRTSLTVKLVVRSRRFYVQWIRQGRGMTLADEYMTVRLPRRTQVREREVVLRCDERPMVYAHTIVPLAATASDWPFFNTLGERSLGTTLFGDPAVRRGALQYARLHPRHPLVQRACEAIDMDSVGYPLYARRCLFQRKNGVLLVTEVFLPAIADIDGPAPDSSKSALKKNSLPVGALSGGMESQIWAGQ
jgi:chorismate--pyruvate lyase